MPSFIYPETGDDERDLIYKVYIVKCGYLILNHIIMNVRRKKTIVTLNNML